MHGSAQSNLHDAVTSMLLAMLASLNGDAGAILLGAFAGSLWPVSSLKTETRTAALLLMTKLAFTALALAGFAAYLLEIYPGLPPNRTLMPAAFLIALMGNKWTGAQEHLAAALKKLFWGLVRGALRKADAAIGEDK